MQTPGSPPVVALSAVPPDLGRPTVGAGAGLGMVDRAPGRDGDDSVAVDPVAVGPATSRSQVLSHVREGSAIALAALPGR